LFVFRVDFIPDEDRTIVRKTLFRTAAPAFGLASFIFDGSTLFTIRTAPNESITPVVTSPVSV
jgi:hypothetical protein